MTKHTIESELIITQTSQTLFCVRRLKSPYIIVVSFNENTVKISYVNHKKTYTV